MAKSYTTADILNTPIARGGLVPLTEYANRVEFDPLGSGLTGSAYRALTAPGRAWRGEIAEDQLIDEGNNFAGLMTLGGYMTAAAPSRNALMSAYKSMGPADAPINALSVGVGDRASRYIMDDGISRFSNTFDNRMTRQHPHQVMIDDMLESAANYNSRFGVVNSNARPSAAPGLMMTDAGHRRAASHSPGSDMMPSERAEALGYAPERFWRGEATGNLPNTYPGGAFFSRDKEYATGFANRGGLDEPREFRLDLSTTFQDYAPVTANTYARLARSLAESNPKAAAEMVDMIAPGKTVGWLSEFAARNGDMVVADNGALVRQVVEQSATSPVRVFRQAGFDALDSGRDVRKLAGEGIRLATAKFDPKKKASLDITAGLAGLLGYGGLYGED